MDPESLLPWIELNEYEKEIYSYLFSLADADADGFVGSGDAAFFLKCTGVQDHLHDIWNYVNVNGKNKLNRNAFAAALRLVCLAQQGQPISISEIQKPREWCIPLMVGIQLPSPAKQPMDTQKSEWVISRTYRTYCDGIFGGIPKIQPYYLAGNESREFFSRSPLNMDDLAKVWELADVDKDGRLSQDEFCVALFLIHAKMANRPLPDVLPQSILESYQRQLNLEGRPEDLRKVADDCFQSGDFDGAEKYYTASIHKGKEQIACCYHLRACAKLSQNKIDESLKDCGIALQYDSKLAKAYLQRSICYLQKAMFKEAQEDINRALELDPMDQQIAQQVQRVAQAGKAKSTADEFKKRGKWQDAYEAYKLLLDTCPGLMTALLGFAEAAVQINRMQEAAASIRMVLSKDPNHIEAAWIKARVIYHTDGEVSNVLETIKSVLKLDSDHTGALELQNKVEKLMHLRQKGNEIFQAQKYEEAVKIYTDALDQEDKKLPTAFTAIIFANRAAAYKQLGDFDKAIEDLSMAIIRNTNYPKAYIRRAQCYAEIELWEEAINDYSTAAAVQPFNREYTVMLQNAQLKLQEQKNRSYYDVMGIAAFATTAEIKKAYRVLALKYHPDKVASSGISPLKAEKLFKEISFCHEFLTDPQKKSQYDRELQIQRSMHATLNNINGRYSAPFMQSASNPYGQQQQQQQQQQQYSSYGPHAPQHRDQQNAYATAKW